MKRSLKTEILKNTNDELCGVWLQANFQCEHECGITELYRLMDVDTSILGIEGRTMKSAECIEFYDTDKETYFCGRWKYSSDNEDAVRYLEGNRELHGHQDNPIYSVWSSEGFVVCAIDEENKAYLRNLYEASQNKDLAFWIGGFGDNPFSRGGLCIAIVSKLDPDNIEELTVYDKNEIALKEASQKTGIPQFIKDKVICYSLKSFWNEDNHSFKKKESQHPIVFFFSGKRNQEYTVGFYTVEALTEWITHGTGLIQEEIQKKETAKTK